MDSTDELLTLVLTNMIVQDILIIRLIVYLNNRAYLIPLFGSISPTPTRILLRNMIAIHHINISIKLAHPDPDNIITLRIGIGIDICGCGCGGGC